MTEETTRVINIFDVNRDEYKKIYLNSLKAAYCSEDIKEELAKCV